jgi:hypothetical protein
MNLVTNNAEKKIEKAVIEISLTALGLTKIPPNSLPYSEWSDNGTVSIEIGVNASKAEIDNGRSNIRNGNDGINNIKASLMSI